MKQDRQTCVLYVTATCNLKCRYCYIDKSPVLLKIDKMLEESYEGDYYFNFMKDIFDKNILHRIEFWGGEPTYGLKRARPTVEKALTYFTNINEFFFSTNLTMPRCIEDIYEFFTFVDLYPERHFNIHIQLSLDGPTEINDYNRGERTTELFTKNFSKLIYTVSDYLDKHPNINIQANFKPTLDSSSIAKLQTKEDVKNYYLFLEQYKLIADSYVAHDRWFFDPAIPNTATPSPHTTEEGKMFANFCRFCNELEEEKPFKFYDKIMPFANHCGKECRLDHGYGTCGTGHSICGLLPNRLISGCHNGFVELVSDYKARVASEGQDSSLDASLFINSYQNHMIFTEAEFEVFGKQMKAYNADAVFQKTEMCAVIMQMAAAGQIDKQYVNAKKAAEGAHFIQSSTCSCMRDNLGVSGSLYLTQLGFLRLFLNGAKEEIEKHNEKNRI